MKKLLILIFAFISTSFIYSQNLTKTIKFLKGNIADKTAAVREASGTEAVFLSNKAINFCLENKEILGNDRDLEGLAVAAVLSISPEYAKSCSEEDKLLLENQFMELFAQFKSSSTVQIAVLTKSVALKDYIPTDKLTANLNDYLAKANVNTEDATLFRAVFNSLEFIGNNETFLILYGLLNNQNYKKYHAQIDSTLTALVPKAMNEILSLIQNTNTSQVARIFSIIKKNTTISKNNLCEIAQSVLSQSIISLEGTSGATPEQINLQLDTLAILSENRWTRASSVSVSYFKLAKRLYNSGDMNEIQFKTAILALADTAPIDSVPLLTAYLEDLNSLTEKGNVVSSDVILAVIKALGAIGDKSAFDSLLAVTYLNYSEQVLSAARGALSELRWQ
ncbi:MAG: HEAT repeat domain-containing protein [Treponema sp.]|nr:HEAT repeat domain-containing protein [Treponema sp.]